MQIAKLFNNGRSQAVRLPAAFRFEGTEVYVRRDETTGDVILSKRPSDWSGFLEAVSQCQGETLDIVRDEKPAVRDPFEAWTE